MFEISREGGLNWAVGNVVIGKGENRMNKEVDAAFNGNTKLAFRKKEGSKGRGNNLKDDGSADAAISSAYANRMEFGKVGLVFV
jgi:hypothetical protein